MDITNLRLKTFGKKVAVTTPKRRSTIESVVETIIPSIGKGTEHEYSLSEDFIEEQNEKKSKENTEERLYS